MPQDYEALVKHLAARQGIQVYTLMRNYDEESNIIPNEWVIAPEMWDDVNKIEGTTMFINPIQALTGNDNKLHILPSLLTEGSIRDIPMQFGSAELKAGIVYGIRFTNTTEPNIVDKIDETKGQLYTNDTGEEFYDNGGALTKVSDNMPETMNGYNIEFAVDDGQGNVSDPADPMLKYRNADDTADEFSTISGMGYWKATEEDGVVSVLALTLINMYEFAQMQQDLYNILDWGIRISDDESTNLLISDKEVEFTEGIRVTKEIKMPEIMRVSPTTKIHVQDNEGTETEISDIITSNAVQDIVDETVEARLQELIIMDTRTPEQYEADNKAKYPDGLPDGTMYFQLTEMVGI